MKGNVIQPTCRNILSNGQLDAEWAKERAMAGGGARRETDMNLTVCHCIIQRSFNTLLIGKKSESSQSYLSHIDEHSPVGLSRNPLMGNPTLTLFIKVLRQRRML